MQYFNICIQKIWVAGGKCHSGFPSKSRTSVFENIRTDSNLLYIALQRVLLTEGIEVASVTST